jgi:hypothetical protein
VQPVAEFIKIGAVSIPLPRRSIALEVASALSTRRKRLSSISFHVRIFDIEAPWFVCLATRSAGFQWRWAPLSSEGSATSPRRHGMS